MGKLVRVDFFVLYVSLIIHRPILLQCFPFVHLELIYNDFEGCLKYVISFMMIVYVKKVLTSFARIYFCLFCLCIFDNTNLLLNFCCYIDITKFCLLVLVIPVPCIFRDIDLCRKTYC